MTWTFVNSIEVIPHVSQLREIILKNGTDINPHNVSIWHLLEEAGLNKIISYLNVGIG